MKKVFFPALLFVVLTSVAPAPSRAQTAGEPVLQQAVAGIAVSKGTRFPDKSTAVRIAKNAVSTKVVRSFTQSFGNAKNDEWLALNNRVFAVYFENEGRNARAAFEKNGYMLYCVTDGAEKDLPKENRRVIKSNYVDYDIIHAAQVTSEGRTVWVVNLQDADNIVIVRVADGSLDEMSRYKKSKR